MERVFPLPFEESTKMARQFVSDPRPGEKLVIFLLWPHEVIIDAGLLPFSFMETVIKEHRIPAFPPWKEIT